ncbi:hypothetical protein L6164_037169 [Bauhinia variegata]|uniref:Uncharacterized protein n=1 Tax=Bauhinia variegata TaxID=167791 RepID=A0ACB9KJH9_BAUVA|nr:hypothetical protein L6164_037169 [Bauhinia variegata]
MSMSEIRPMAVREVWQHNFHTEFSLILEFVRRHPFASIDTEFPGTIYKPMVDKRFYSKLPASVNYQLMKRNVNSLNIIQLGLTLSNATGTESCTWEFNFRDFDIRRDFCDTESIQLLQKQGIDFERNRILGIDSRVFGMMIRNSGLMLNQLTWATFHSCYDFGYLIKILTWQHLPPDVGSFMFLVGKFFGPRVYDMKHIMRFCDGLYGGLEKVATTLKVDRQAGKSHQAGSDSLLTLHTFMKLRDVYFGGSCRNKNLSLRRFQGILYGFEVNAHCLIR